MITAPAALTMSGCTISGNTAGSAGGGITNLSVDDPAKLTVCTISGNTAGGSGGGIDNYHGTLYLYGGTVSGNSANGDGGGIINACATLTLTGGTVSGNTATDDGGGILNEYTNSTLTMTGCTISGNTSAAGGNIACIGATLAMTGCTIKQRYATIYGGGLLNDGSASVVGCYFYENRAPKEKSGSDYYGTGGGILNESSMKLTACSVSGNQAAVGGGGISNMKPPRLASYHLGYSLAMYDCTVNGNTALGAGGGVYNATNVSLGMIDCTISGNHAILPEVNGQVVGYGFGGGIGNAGKLSMFNCTVYENGANNGGVSGHGGGIANTGTATLSNCTLTSNSASSDGIAFGGDIYSFGLGMTMNNCIVADSSLIGGDIVGSASGDNNFVDDPFTAGVLQNNVNGNIVQNEDPVLSTPGFYGGLTKTMVPLPGSPVIGEGDPSLIPPGVTTDQRGAPRTQGGKVDIGAVEAGPITITVTTLADNISLPIIDGSVTSLREAIDYADADAYTGDTITFAAGLTGTIALTLGALPAINTPLLTIAGPGAGLLTIDAQGNSRIVSIDSGATVSISGLTLENGSAANGGAIANDGTLTLNLCSITGATSSEGGGLYNSGTATLIDCTAASNMADLKGGGIDNAGKLTLTGCTVSGNTTGIFGVGGGIYNTGTLTLTNCTMAANASAFDGGGVDNQEGTLTFADCTVADNAAGFGGGGILNVDGNATLNNTIVAGNSSGGDLSGAVTGSHDLIDDREFRRRPGQRHRRQHRRPDPDLGPLANNGGPTQTMALPGGSPAINSGSNALVPSGVTTDQRGAQRIKDGAADIGAFESGQSVITVTTLADSDGSGTTLRQAIDYVDNIDPQGGVTIIFASGLQGTLDLTQGMLPLITGDLAIVGPGASLLTIDCAGEQPHPVDRSRSGRRRLRADAGRRQRSLRRRHPQHRRHADDVRLHHLGQHGQ